MTWRPIKYYRTATKRQVIRIDNQIRVSTRLDGLAFFEKDEKIEEWKDWRHKPNLHLATDCGSDCVSMYYALAFFYRLAVWFWPDPSHGCARSFDHFLNDLGLWNLWLLLLVTWNLEFGPHRDSERRNQIRTLLDTVYKFRKPHEVPIFEAAAPTIAAELEAAGLASFPRERPLNEELWDWLKTDNAAGTMGRRVAMNRFGAPQHAAMYGQGLWSKRLMERTVLALEQDWLTGEKFLEKMQIKPGAPEAGGETSEVGTNPKLITVSDKIDLSGMRNAVVTSVATLQNSHHHQRGVDQVIELQKPLDKYFKSSTRLTCCGTSTGRKSS